MSDLCTCTNYSGTERTPTGVKVCERCGKPDNEDAATQRMLDFILSEPGDPRYRHLARQTRDGWDTWGDEVETPSGEQQLNLLAPYDVKFVPR